MNLYYHKRFIMSYFVLQSKTESILSTNVFVKTRVASDADFKPQA